VHEELENMIELIGEGVDGTCLCSRDVVLEGERLAGLIADYEGDVLKVSMFIGDLSCEVSFAPWRRACSAVDGWQHGH
jgi:hypothetical protein